MKTFIETKLILAGKTIELYKYVDKSVCRGDTRVHYIQRSRQPRKKLERSINRAHTNLRRIIASNEQLKYFFTLTFAENVLDIKQANKEFANFCHRLKRLFPNFQYVAVPERQKRGAIHYHLVTNDFSGVGFVDYNLLRKIWGFGRLEFARVKKINNMSFYLSKYLTKQDDTFYNKKRFFCSQNLFNCIEFLNEEADLVISFLSLKLKKLFNLEFFNKYLGLVRYDFFDLLEKANLTSFFSYCQTIQLRV